MAQVFDLFGDPVPENWGMRGRPQHVVTKENVNKVTMLVALGWGNERIANSLDVTLPTLRKHYFSLIKRMRDTARDRLEATYAMKVWQQVDAGVVGAMRLWVEFLERNDRMELERSLGRSSDAAGPALKPADRVGKKVIDERRAMEADADLTAELELEALASQNAVH